MRKLVSVLMLLAFCMSPMALGANVTPEQLYKDTYISLHKKGANPVKVLNDLMASAASNKIEIKDVLASAVAKGFMSQEQMNTALDLAAKNAHLVNDKELVAKINSGKLSVEDMKALQTAFQGQVTGASYYCSYYYGCYYDSVVLVPFTIILIALLFTPVYVYYY